LWRLLLLLREYHQWDKVAAVAVVVVANKKK